MDYASIKTEIALPAYAGMNDIQIATALNTKTATVPRISVSGNELLQATTLSELLALTAAQTSAYWGLVAMGTIQAAVGSNARTILAALFPAGSATRTALTALVATTTTAPWYQAIAGRPLDFADVVAARSNG